MIQLKVYPTTAKNRADQIYLDLYDTEPIKLTLSIEDITDADATSVFSRTFKIPATRHNNQFFTTAFEINGVDYDVTVKKPAEILVDGQEFRHGHIRLQKVYVNGDQDKTDYELLFLGETRDFSSIIGDTPLCQLIMDDLLIGGTTNPRNPTVSDMEASWQAFPEGTSVDSNGNPDSGLNDGNIIFPLIDHGNEYDEAGDVVGVEIKIDDGAGSKSFTKSTNPLPLSRLKPMIRVKRVWDQIFENAGYTYTSNYINSPQFHQMYISAWGNTPTTGYSTIGSSQNLLNAEYNSTQNQGTGFALYLPDNIYDPGNNYQVGTLNSGSIYIAPGTAIAGDSQNKFTIVAEAYVAADVEVSCPGFCTDPCPVRLQLYNMSTGQVLKQSAPGYQQFVGFTFDSEFDNIGVNQGDFLVLRAEVTCGASPDFDEVHSINWQVTAAPGVLYPAADLDCDYKQIDFIKDILKMFRLVLSPDVNDTNNFIVEPWQDYINSGDLHDWSHKLVKNKDVVLEPLFNTQSETIDFKFQEDEDYINVYHQEQYKQPYGYLRFDSNNDLLKGTRTIETLEVAPTPIGTIQENGVTTVHQAPGWIIPQIHANESEDSGTQHLPIKAKPRILFYNGLVDIPQPSGGLEWYLNTSATSYTNYPLVSSFENWPQTQGGLNLNWANDIKYWSQVASTQIFNTDGQTLYDRFWSRYIGSLYNKFSRRMTAYFVLNNVDLQNFSFDDTIFVNGKYWRPEKIIDVNIGERTEVKVQLISALDYVPPAYIDEQLTNFSVSSTNEVCGCDGIISVTTDGASPFTWQLSNGQTGEAITSGANPQQFNITGICAGSYNVTVVDDLGRYNTGSVTIGASSVNVTAQFTVTDATNCQSPCNGQVTVTPAGGTAPYTIQWQDGGTGNRTDLCPGTHPFVVIDANGCESDAYDAVVGCSPADPVYELNGLDSNCNDTGVIYYAESATLQIGDVVKIQEHSGCYEIHSLSQEAPNVTITTDYADCASCNGASSGNTIYFVNCDGTEYKTASSAANPNLQPFDVVTLVGLLGCWEVNYFGTGSSLQWDTVDDVYTDCEECANDRDDRYWVLGCNEPAETLVVGPYGAGGCAEPDPVGQGIATTTPTYDPNGWYVPTPTTPNPGLYLTKDDGTLRVTFEGTAEFCNYQPGQIIGNPPLGLVSSYDDTAGPPYSNIGSYYLYPTPDYVWPTQYTSGTFNFSLTYILDTYEAWLAMGSPSTRDGVFMDFVMKNRYRIDPSTDRDELAVQFYSINTSINVYQLSSGGVLTDTPARMTSGSGLSTSNVVTVNETAGCFDILYPANELYIERQTVPPYSYNSNGGVFDNCETCTGGVSEQNCHTVSATTTPTTFTYTYDDGTGPASYFVTLNSGQSDTICAQLNSIAIATGTGTITDLGTNCFATSWGTSCDTQPTPTRYCYTLTGGGGTIGYTEYQWFENNVSYQQKLKDGASINVCADDGTPQAISGISNITGGTTTCTSVADCVTCYTYLFEGGPGLDLNFTACDGTTYYLSDVFLAGGGIGVLPYCIASLNYGSAIPFMSQNNTCTIP